jgi:hypothetical protein
MSKKRGRLYAVSRFEQPTKFDLVINLTALPRLGFRIPGKLLSLASEVGAAFFAALHYSADGRYCCKSRKLPGDNFPAESR